MYYYFIMYGKLSVMGAWNAPDDNAGRPAAYALRAVVRAIHCCDISLIVYS